jgi:drug/metabolite transporter (DMT)-like permease
MMVYVLGLLAAFTYALGIVLQQRADLQVPAAEADPRFLGQIIRKPVWLIGGLLQVGGWALQAAALDKGSLVVVQALLAVSLVFAMLLGLRLTRQRFNRWSLIGASSTLVGITLFVAFGQPQGGKSAPSATAWWVSALVLAVVVAFLVFAGYRTKGAPRAALLGTAAGMAFALQAAVTKLLVTEFAHGLLAVFTTWPLYAFIAPTIGGYVLQQWALRTGFLAPATAAVNGSTLAVSVILGILIFEESISQGHSRLAPALVGLGLAVLGVAVLAYRQPRRRGGKRGPTS